MSGVSNLFLDATNCLLTIKGGKSATWVLSWLNMDHIAYYLFSTCLMWRRSQAKKAVHALLLILGLPYCHGDSQRWTGYPVTEVEFSMQLCTLSPATGQPKIVMQNHSSK